jgi:hypothetical protein
MARYGLIKITTEWREDGSNKRNPQTIQPHPWLHSTLSAGAKVSHKFQAAKHYAATGVERLDLPFEAQGFKTVTEVGSDEPEEVKQDTPEETAEKITELIKRDDEIKARKMREAQEWKIFGNRFVDGAAALWKFAQKADGYGGADPIWAGPTNRLSPAARKERLELTKIFEQYGGKTSAVAWYIYTCAEPVLDENTGKRKYDPLKPHTQNVTIDRRPSQFARYFNSILADGSFKNFTTKKWDEISTQLKLYFPETFETPPRDGLSEHEKVGYAFGDTSPTLSEVRA